MIVMMVASSGHDPNEEGDDYGLLPSSVMMQARMAVSAPVLSPAVRGKASLPQACGAPSESHSHTRMDRVLVLLRDGLPLSTISTGRRYSGCSRL